MPVRDRRAAVVLGCEEGCESLRAAGNAVNLKFRR
jgi:hypothetical protein